MNMAHSVSLCRTSTPRRGARAAFVFVLAVAGLLASAGCDSSAWMSLDSRVFTDVQVVSAFPTRTAADGHVVRVCRPGDGPPDGIELNFALIGSTPQRAACIGDRDMSVHSNEVIEWRRVRSSGGGASLGPGRIRATFDDLSPRKGVAAASRPSRWAGLDVPAAAVAWDHVADRCDPGRESTRQNVALVLDHSGSMGGFVSASDSREAPPGSVDLADPLRPSDPAHTALDAAASFVEALNDRDRVIGYYFDEYVGVSVAASDDAGCNGGPIANQPCRDDADCFGGACVPGAGDAGNSFLDLTKSDAEARAFGANADTRFWLHNALRDQVRYGGVGRAPVWNAVSRAFRFLRDHVEGPRHIVLLLDGPDTCAPSEDFSFATAGGICANPCPGAIETFSEVREAMAEAGFPVRVHVVQIQSAGYREPDPRGVEIACLSGGTWQMVRSWELPLNSSALRTAMTRAFLRVRNVLAGSWRATLALPSLASPQGLKPGGMHRLSGALRIEQPAYASLESIYSLSESWRFAIDSEAGDRSLVLARGCASDADCGGSACGAGRCGDDGQCHEGPAADRLPCGGGGVCCGGVCSAECATCGL